MAMTRKIYAFAAVVAVVFCAFAAKANTERDWSEVSGDVEGGIYTVPAETTVIVGDGDIAEVKTLSKVIFASDDSVMKFTTSTFPDNLAFQGPGTALFAKKIVLNGPVTVKRTLGEGDEDRFVNFVFKDGVTNTTPQTERKLTFDPSAFLNATVIFDGSLETNVTCNPYPNRIEFGRNFSSESPRNISVGSGRQQVVRQLGGVIRPTVTDLSLSGGEWRRRVSA